MEDCCILSILLTVSSLATIFGTVLSLHPPSFVSLIFPKWPLHSGLASLVLIALYILGGDVLLRIRR